MKDDRVVVTLTTEQVQQSLARVELGERILLAPPDEDSEGIRELRQMLPGELEVEARELQEWEYDHGYVSDAYGQVDSYTTQFRRMYRLKLVRHVMGDEWFSKVLAPVHAAWADTFRELCPACGGPMRILSFLTDPPVVVAILAHLELPHTRTGRWGST